MLQTGLTLIGETSNRRLRHVAHAKHLYRYTASALLWPDGSSAQHCSTLEIQEEEEPEGLARPIHWFELMACAVTRD